MADRLSPVQITAKLVSFPTVSRDSNLALVDWVEEYPNGHGIAAHRVHDATGDKAARMVSYGTEAGQFQQAGYSAMICGPGDIARTHQPDEVITVAQLDAGHGFMRDLVNRRAAG